MENWQKYLLAAAGGLAGLIAVLYAKNAIQAKSFKPIDKQKVILIIKQIRKDSYNIYKQQIIPMHTQVAMQFRGKITPQQFKEIVEGPEAGMDFKAKIDAITQKACEAHGATPADFERSLVVYGKDREVSSKVQNLAREYHMALSGKLNEDTSVQPPPELEDKNRVLEIQNKIIREKLLIQIDMLRKMAGKSQRDLMENPNLLAEMKNPEAEEERILAEEGLDETDEPASVIFNAAVKKLSATNSQFKIEFANVENKYKKVFEKYAPALQRSNDPQLFDALQQEIIFMP